MARPPRTELRGSHYRQAPTTSGISRGSYGTCRGHLSASRPYRPIRWRCLPDRTGRVSTTVGPWSSRLQEDRTEPSDIGHRPFGEAGRGARRRPPFSGGELQDLPSGGEDPTGPLLRPGEVEALDLVGHLDDAAGV